MSETISEAMDDGQVDEKPQQRARDLARLKTVAFQHGGVATAIFLLWGSAQTFSQAHDGVLIAFIAIASGFFGGTVLAFLWYCALKVEVARGGVGKASGRGAFRRVIHRGAEISGLLKSCAQGRLSRGLKTNRVVGKPGLEIGGCGAKHAGGF